VSHVRPDEGNACRLLAKLLVRYPQGLAGLLLRDAARPDHPAG
jgi:hypothetical protein